MGYLDEAGLAALVGKVKGQMVELTAAEYAQIDPAIKNYDNKIYFVKDDVAGYQIDNEPVANSNGLVKSGGIYNWTSKIGSGTLITTAQTLIPAVNEVNAKIGSTNISSIGDGTVTGAVNALNTGLTDIVAWRNVSISVTIPANGIIYDQTLDVPTISGFKAFAIGGWRLSGGGYADSPFTRLNLNEVTQKIEYAMMTRNGSEVTISGIIKILYIRSNWCSI